MDLFDNEDNRKKRLNYDFEKYSNEIVKKPCEKNIAVETQADKMHIIKRAFEILLEENEKLQNDNTKLQNENGNLTNKLVEAAPKLESYEALQRSEHNMSITECCRHFGLSPKLEVFPFLRTHGYLTSKDLPTLYAINNKVLIERQSLGTDGKYRGQAVVEASSLDLWRTKIIPRIKNESNTKQITKTK